MSRRFDPKAYRALTIDGYDVTDGAFAGHYTMRGFDPADDVSFTEAVNFGSGTRRSHRTTGCCDC